MPPTCRAVTPCFRAIPPIYAHTRFSISGSMDLTLNQIEQWKKKDPDNIHKVPVETGQFNWRMIFRCKATARSLDNQYRQDGEAYNHVQGMHACHRKIERKEQLGILRPRT